MTTEIERYAKSLIYEVTNLQLANEDGDTQEQAFTRIVLDMLAEAGETENADVAFDEKAFGTKNQHKINGYAVADNYETVDLFISIFSTDANFKVYKSDVDRAATRVTNFFRKCTYGDYENEVAESSPIFEFAHTLAGYKELNDSLIRVNAFILTNGEYSGDIPDSISVNGFKFFYRVVDIKYMFQISKQSQVPIKIDFTEEGFDVPCVSIDTKTPDYQAYIAIINGKCLANLYERYGSRLLEQNVRSFLQFTGKINKGIRTTIKEEPHMFLAYNNGIAATADSIVLTEDGHHIKEVNNLQIVNGGQTTASIYYTAKEKADISRIFVQVKFSVINRNDSYSDIVSRISRYSNTQNKVNNADFSANNPYFVEFERLSRRIMTPLTSSANQTFWFFERTRGQYKTSLQKDGFTQSRKKAFLLKYPKSQVITKQELAKYINTYDEVFSYKKTTVGPHIVVRGNEKNFAMFINHNLPSSQKLINNVYFEDTIAKAILFRTADKLYGTKNAERCIGDLKSIVVPYTIAVLRVLTKDNLDLYKIWKNQSLSPELKQLLYDLMVEVNKFIISSSPQAYYSEWAKKEECWNKAKEHKWSCNINDIKADLVDPNKPSKRRVTEISEDSAAVIAHERAILQAIPHSLWTKIAEWGQSSGCLNVSQQANAREIAYNLKFHHPLKEHDRYKGMIIYEIVCEKNIELLEEADELAQKDEAVTQDSITNQDNTVLKSPEGLTMEILRQMVEWENVHHKLESWKLRVMTEVLNGAKPLSKYRSAFFLNYLKIKAYGFKVSL